MSKMLTGDIQCPSCEYNQDVTIWESINVTLNPELKDKFLNHQINFFKCQKCKEEVFVNAPLLYHDMNQKFCVQYFPPEFLDDDEFYEQFGMDGTISMAGLPEMISNTVTYMSRPHIVFNINEMINHVVFRDRIASSASA